MLDFFTNIVKDSVIFVYDYFSNRLIRNETIIINFKLKDKFSIVSIREQLSITLVRK